MVDGVHGYLDHVVRHVVEEYRIILEYVIILNLHVEEKNVMVPALIHSIRIATILVVQVLTTTIISTEKVATTIIYS